jgi:hypothetical protein
MQILRAVLDGARAVLTTAHSQRVPVIFINASIQAASSQYAAWAGGV